MTLFALLACAGGGDPGTRDRTPTFALSNDGDCAGWVPAEGGTWSADGTPVTVARFDAQAAEGVPGTWIWSTTSPSAPLGLLKYRCDEGVVWLEGWQTDLLSGCASDPPGPTIAWCDTPVPLFVDDADVGDVWLGAGRCWKRTLSWPRGCDSYADATEVESPWRLRFTRASDEPVTVAGQATQARVVRVEGASANDVELEDVATFRWVEGVGPVDLELRTAPAVFPWAFARLGLEPEAPTR